MSADHDPLCPCFAHPDWLPEYNCRCELITQVGERIAQAIEAATELHYAPSAVKRAARIARNGGADERAL